MTVSWPHWKGSGRLPGIGAICIGFTLGSYAVSGAIPSGAAPIHPSSQLQGVSCPAVRICVAVGTSSPDEYGGIMRTLVEVFGGKSWSIQPSPTVGSWSGLFGVSCPTAGFCVGVGYDSIGEVASTEVAQKTLIEAYNGRSWSVMPSTNPGLSSKKVKPCSSPTALKCETVQPPADGADRLSGVACATRSLCVAVGQATSAADYPLGQPLIEVYHGSKWSAARSPSVLGGGDLEGVSCANARFCMAVGSSGSGTLVEAFDGKSWSVVPSPNKATNFYNLLSGVSCASRASCHAVGYYYLSKSAGEIPLAESYTGTSWTLDSIATPPAGGQLNGISCATSNSCVAVGLSFSAHDGESLAYTMNAGPWTSANSAAVPGSSQPGLAAVSCASAHSCIAVGSHYGGNSNYLTTTEVFNGDLWSQLSSDNVTLRLCARALARPDGRPSVQDTGGRCASRGPAGGRTA